MLHGEQYIKVVKPMPAAGTLTNTYKVQDVLDKGRGMVLLVQIETRDEEGELLLVNQSSIFVVGAGGFGGSRSSEHSIEVRNPPSRSADARASYKTSKDQAALYRMTGDLNRGQRDSSTSGHLSQTPNEDKMHFFLNLFHFLCHFWFAQANLNQPHEMALPKIYFGFSLRH